MSQTSIEDLLDAARKLPPDEQRQLAERLINEISRADTNQSQTALEAVKQTRGAMKGLDRETIIWLAEDEELCGH
jgi:hypothetical protein